MKFLIQAKLNKKVLQDHTQTADDISLDHTIEYMTEKLIGVADVLVVYIFDSLLDEKSIKFYKEIHLTH